jgi:hypothetical protein
MDFASPADVPIVQRYIARHRLAGKDVSAAVGEPVKPIVYYVDRAIPGPIRSAVLEGVDGGTRRSRSLVTRMPFRSGCCRKMPIPWTSATT